MILTRGQRALVTVEYAAAGPCLPRVQTAYGLELVPPGGRRALRLHVRRFTLCAVSLGGHPRVTPVRAGLNR